MSFSISNSMPYVAHSEGGGLRCTGTRRCGQGGYRDPFYPGNSAHVPLGDATPHNPRTNSSGSDGTTFTLPFF